MELSESCINENRSSKPDEDYIARVESQRKEKIPHKHDDDYISMIKTSIAEGIAYFFIILAIFFSEGEHVKFIYAFWCIFLVFGNVSGAHVNPLVTVGLFIYKGNMLNVKNIIRMLLYLIFQFFGGALAALMGSVIYKKTITHINASVTATDFDVFFVECFFGGTFVFVCLFITCNATRPSDKNYVNLTLIAMWLYLIINAGSNISGGCYNPTVFLVLNGLAKLKGIDEDAFDKFEFYIFTPFIGSFIFTMIFKYIFKPYYISKHRIVISEDDD
jgi:hypothetical protein